MNTFGFKQPFGLSGGRIRLGFGSIALAKILYSDPFTYTLDESGNSIVTNQGSGSDMLMYSGRYLDLVNQATDIPIHHTLGADTKQAATLGAGWTDNGSHSYTGATASSSLSNLSTGTSVPSVLIDFTITAYTSGSVGGKSALGTYTVESTTESLTGVSFVGTVLINSVKQITNPNSYLTYWNITANALVNIDCSTLTPSQKYTLNNIKVNNILATTNAPSASDIAKINSNPNLLGALALSPTNTIPELDWVLDGTQKYYPCMEVSNKFVVDTKSSGIEKIVNGGFNTDTDWGKEIGVTISGGRAVFTNVPILQDSLYQLNKVQVGKRYIIKYDIVNYINGSVTMTFGHQQHTERSGNGTYVEIVANTVGNLNVIFKAKTNLTNLSIDNVSVREATASEIANYTTTARKKSHNKGLQTTAFTLDALGVPTAYDVSKLNFYSNEYGNSQTNLSTVGNFWLEEVIGSTIYQHKYDGTNLTTYTNNVAGTPTAHTPENANYLVGKGVYPKVTANPLATYTQSVFNLYTDGLYTSYNQASRYTALGA